MIVMKQIKDSLRVERAYIRLENEKKREELQIKRVKRYNTKTRDDYSPEL